MGAQMFSLLVPQSPNVVPSPATDALHVSISILPVRCHTTESEQDSRSGRIFPAADRTPCARLQWLDAGF